MSKTGTFTFYSIIFCLGNWLTQWYTFWYQILHPTPGGRRDHVGSFIVCFRALHLHSVAGFSPILALSTSTFCLIVSWLPRIPVCRASSTAVFSLAALFSMFCYCFSSLSMVSRICAAMSCTLAFCSILSTMLGKLSRVTFTGLACLNSFVINSLLWPIASSLFCSLSLLSSLLLLCSSSTSARIYCALFWK